MEGFKTYRKKPTATVKAKLFEPGDEDGFGGSDVDLLDAMEDAKYGINTQQKPYVETLENKYLYGEFGKHQLLVADGTGERWLVELERFKNTYEEVND